jgi:drug/metabolite transporter (DMT)-like permease
MMRIALVDIPPFSMRVGNLFIGALTLVVVALAQGRRIAIPDARTGLHLCAAALLNIVGFSIFTPFAQLAAATSRVTIIVYTMPIWASLLARPVLGERLDAIQAVALLLCVAGMGVLVYPLASRGIPLGILFALGAAVSWGAGTVYLKWARLGGDPITITIWQIVIALILIAACLPVFEGSLHMASAGAPALFALVFTGMIGTGISYFLWFDIVRRLPAATASLGILSVPVVGVIASVLLLGERPTLTDIAGLVLIFAASACVLLRPQAPANPPDYKDG